MITAPLSQKQIFNRSGDNVIRRSVENRKGAAK
jgi:hypothetical protein